MLQVLFFFLCVQIGSVWHGFKIRILCVDKDVPIILF